MLRFYLKNFALLIIFTLCVQCLYSAVNDENTQPSNISNSIQQASTNKPSKKRKRETLKQAAKGSLSIEAHFKKIAEKNLAKSLQAPDAAHDDIVFDRPVSNAGSLSAQISTKLDITTQSSFSETPIAMIIPYEDGSFLAKAIIEERSIYELFYDSPSAESWIIKIFQDRGMPSPVRGEPVLDAPLQEFDQAREQILAKRNPFAKTEDKMISAFVIDPTQISQIKHLDDGRFLARLLINPEIQHNAFKYFDDSQFANDWISAVTERYLKKPVLTQEEKKGHKALRSKRLL